MASAVSASVQSLEDAASLASELITSLDNLPNEVQHLLNEIRLKDRRCQELQQDIARDQAKYIKHSLRHDLGVPPSPTPINGKFNFITGETSQIAAQNKPSPKAHLPPRIAASYVEIDALSNEKVALAQRIIDLLTRTRARVDANLAHVYLLQGESANVSTPYNTRRPEGMSGSMNSVVQPGEGTRGALTSRSGSADSILPSPLPTTATASTYNKKRRLTTTTSIKLQSPAPSTPQATSSTSHPKSRLSRQVHVIRSQQQRQDEEDLDADAEGEEDLEEDADDDLTPYCFCHKPSFGDMIGCDNPECPYQWFHISCVGVKTPLPDKWYCPECIKNKNAVPERRKGRKK